jgi:hypothetical protein
MMGIMKWRGKEVLDSRCESGVKIEIEIYNILQPVKKTMRINVKNVNNALKEYPKDYKQRNWFLKLKGKDVWLIPPMTLNYEKNSFIHYGITPSIYYKRFNHYIEESEKTYTPLEQVYRKQIERTYAKDILLV